MHKHLSDIIKSVLDSEDDFDYNNDSEVENSLPKQCNSCGYEHRRMFKDLDGLDICKYCLDLYGP